MTDCANFEKTVVPYIPQFYDVFQQILESITNPQALKILYVSTNPLISAFSISLLISPIFLVAAEINRNYSQVDRFWSLLPTLYNAHFVFYAHLLGLPTARLDAVLTTSIIWSSRLTFNYWRKGGYSIGSEDYRWEVLREHIPSPLFFLFDVVFISLAQNILLFSVSMPTYVMLLAAKKSGNYLDAGDLGFSAVMVAFVALSFAADQQQWNFQSAKQKYQKTAKAPTQYHREDLDRGFNVVGLWSWSRHPNFAAEQSVWVTLYVWSCYTTKTYYNWTGVGAICYLCLFQASTWFTELISAKKYPEYKEYQKRVGKFFPKLVSNLPGDFSDQYSKKIDSKSQ
ncbi:MAG: hypothetical protein Q9195_000952 [Heterodermia aff. obscurata]